MKKIIFNLTITLSYTVFSIAQNNYEIFRENKTSQHELGINKFYFVHHTFADSFYMTDLYQTLNYDQMTQILHHVYDGVTVNEKVNVEFSLKKPSDSRIAYFFKEVNDKDSLFIMLTNFNKEKRKFEPKPKPDDQLARWYVIKGEKLVYRKSLFSKEEEEKKKKTGDPTDIIGYYLFDDNYENDELVKPMIDEVISNNTDKTFKFYAYLYLMEYYLLYNDLENAEAALKNLTNSFEQNSEISRNNKLIVDMATTEFEIMKRF